MRLGFHYHIPAKQKEGAIFVPGYLGCFLDSLAACCERLVCFLHTPRPDEEPNLDYPLRAGNIALVSLGPHVSIPRRMLSSARLGKLVRAEFRGLDAMLIRGPSPLLPVVARAAAPAPTALLLVGDYLAGVDDLPQPRWRKELIRLWSRYNKSQQDRVACRSLTIVNSRKLYTEYQPIARRLVETRTSTLTSADFFTRLDTCQAPPYHLLYTGRLDRAKGLLVMVEALAALARDGEDVLLDLVGWPQKGDPILAEVQALAHRLGIAERVKYHGYHAVGPDLFAFYKNSDLYLIASLASEGFPRTIWEAMAHSLPVVATRVGSIPDYIGEAAVLVEPGSAAALAGGIRALLRDPSLRRLSIRAGLGLARQVTLDAQVPKMAAEIQQWILEHHGC